MRIRGAMRTARRRSGFIEDIAKKTDYYKQLSARYPDDPDSVNYYMNLPHRVKLFDYNAPDQVRTEMMSAMDSIRYMVKFLHCAFVAMEPETGAVKAWVGDIDYNHWQYDKVTAERQPGSTFKLCVYTAAMEAGLGPCDDRVDEWKQYDAFDKDGKPTKWTPRNANGYYTGGAMSLKHAFSNSINSVAVSVAHEVGLNRVADVAHKLGITSPIKRNSGNAARHGGCHSARTGRRLLHGDEQGQAQRAGICHPHRGQRR